KYIGPCSVKDPLYTPDGDLFRTDCDSAEWCSGGSLLRDDGSRLTLVAIDESSSESPEELNRAIAEERVNVGPYSKPYWSSQFRRVSRDFLTALRKLDALPPLKMPATLFDEPSPPLDPKHLNGLPTVEELGIKRVGP